eukprot:TRINITY_DN9897_c1_g1_i1.p1 TRINITY_DN9897_c1_g1~~TRINITY_DN9897_c1_g1_i1.p1  ORF type:complete len:184 (+),score=46.68 TRINITY_DN9897_c1_g1_i1:92-643(+)
MAPKTLASPAKPKAKVKVKANAKATKLPSPIQHPPYFQMISEAISSLKDRTGSSQQAISKFIEEKYKNNLPPNFKKLLSIQLKRFAKSEKLVKIKHSFKIASTEKAKKVVVENKEKKKKVKAVVAAKKGEGKEKKKAGVVKTAKTKKLSQVSTPKRMKKSLTPKKKIVKSIKSPKRVTKKVKA